MKMKTHKVVKPIISVLMLIACSGCVTTSGTNLSPADELIKAKKYREAEILLTRETQEKQNDFVVRSKLLTVGKALAQENLAKAEYTKAGADLDAAETTLTALKLIGLNPEAIVPKGYEQATKNHEDELVTLKSELTRAVDGVCNILLSEADGWAKDAEHTFPRKNDRESVVNGLVRVRKCNEHGKWLSIDTRGRSTNSIRRLLALVEENERNDMLRSAGFAP